MAFAKENTEVQISLMPEETIYYHCPSYNALSSDSRTSIKQAWKKKKKIQRFSIVTRTVHISNL